VGVFDTLGFWAAPVCSRARGALRRGINVGSGLRRGQVVEYLLILILVLIVVLAALAQIGGLTGNNLDGALNGFPD